MYTGYVVCVTGNQLTKSMSLGSTPVSSTSPSSTVTGAQHSRYRAQHTMAVASHRKTVTHEAEEFRQLKFGRPALIITDRQTDIKAEETRRGVQGGVHAEQSVGSYDAILLTHLEALPAGGTDLAARSAGTAARPAARGCPWGPRSGHRHHTYMYVYISRQYISTHTISYTSHICLPPSLSSLPWLRRR